MTYVGGFFTQFLITVRHYISLYKNQRHSNQREASTIQNATEFSQQSAPAPDILALGMIHWQKFVATYFYFKGKWDNWKRGGCNPASTTWSSTEKCVTIPFPTQGQCTV
jgi:hypothetical protein